MCPSCSESLDNFMTSEETEAGDVEVIGQDAQAAKSHIVTSTLEPSL